MRIGIGVSIATAIAISVAILTSGGSAPAGTANEWAQAAGSCTRSSTPVAYNAATSCSSMSAAYAIAFPGDTVGITGTLTSTQTIAASTTNGKPGTTPVTFRFEPGAKISKAVCDPCLDIGNRSYITVDGGTNGTIEATANGTGLANNLSTQSIYVSGCDNCTIKNLNIANNYVKTCAPCDDSGGFDHTLSRGIDVAGGAQNLTISGNTIHDVGWGIYYNGGNVVHIDHNDIYHMDHGITLSGTGTQVFVNNNRFHDMANWDGAANNCCHHDPIHCYTVNGGVPNDYSGGIYIYDNRFYGTLGGTSTAEIFMEGNAGGGATPCSAAANTVAIFNNILTFSDNAATNPLLESTTGTQYIFNNTMYGLSTTFYNINQPLNPEDNTSSWDGASMLENNVTTTFNRYASIEPAHFTTVDYNIWANAVDWDCGGSIQTTFAGWKTCIGGDSHGANPGSANLDSNGVPQAGSAAIGGGVNLTSTCNGFATYVQAACKADIDGTARPAVAAWDAGAYEVTP